MTKSSFKIEISAVAAEDTCISYCYYDTSFHKFEQKF